MDSRKIVLKETAIVSIGVLVGSALMIGVYAALGKLSGTVLWSAGAGALVMIVNYFVMAINVTKATERAKAGDAVAAKKMVQRSGALRFFLMVGVLALGIYIGAEVVALVLPLLFVRPTLFLAEFFRKKEDTWTGSM